jgi:hypothetical protein
MTAIPNPPVDETTIRLGSRRSRSRLRTVE